MDHTWLNDAFIDRYDYNHALFSWAQREYVLRKARTRTSDPNKQREIALYLAHEATLAFDNNGIEPVSVDQELPTGFGLGLMLHKPGPLTPV